jgi:hypothetical protein
LQGANEDAVINLLDYMLANQVEADMAHMKSDEFKEKWKNEMEKRLFPGYGQLTLLTRKLKEAVSPFPSSPPIYCFPTAFDIAVAEFLGVIAESKVQRVKFCQKEVIQSNPRNCSPPNCSFWADSRRAAVSRFRL